MMQAITTCEIQHKVPAGAIVDIPNEHWYHDTQVGLVRFRYQGELYSVPERMLEVIPNDIHHTPAVAAVSPGT